jgi:hypothetical protein
VKPSQAAAILRIWEQTDFIKHVIPVLQDREEALIAGLVAGTPDDDKARGGIRELRRFVAMHDMALEVLQANSHNGENAIDTDEVF